MDLISLDKRKLLEDFIVASQYLKRRTGKLERDCLQEPVVISQRAMVLNKCRVDLY